MYIEPSDLKQMIARIISHHESEEFEVSKFQRDKLAELVRVKTTRDAAVQERRWQEAYRLGRELEALASHYITKYLPTEREYLLLHGEPPA